MLCRLFATLGRIVHHVAMTNRDWGRLGAAVRSAREALGLSQEQLAAVAGVSRSTVQGLERGRVPKSEAPSSLPHIERALGWPAGTALEVAEGAEAPDVNAPKNVSLARPPAMARDGMLDRLPAQIREELQAGEVLGVDVVDLGPTSAGTRMIVVVKRDEGGPEPDPEAIREAMEAWKAKQRELRRPTDT